MIVQWKVFFMLPDWTHFPLLETNFNNNEQEDISSPSFIWPHLVWIPQRRRNGYSDPMAKEPWVLNHIYHQWGYHTLQAITKPRFPSTSYPVDLLVFPLFFCADQQARQNCFLAGKKLSHLRPALSFPIWQLGPDDHWVVEQPAKACLALDIGPNIHFFVIRFFPFLLWASLF